PEALARIEEKTAQLLLETHLYALRDALSVSHTEMARQMGIAQPSVAAIGQRGNEMTFSTLTRYVDALGGTARLAVDVPDCL
ncbi:XRE family transcriptional regulator, partial [Cronobacter sakazakii]|uniref:XRE family transcriptional regulator n=1 Tax=Cronobacter sakazakii TaxID=28141 RepID=UPI000D0A9061